MQAMLRPFPLLLVGAISIASPAASDASESYNLSGGSIAVWNLAGAVRVERGTGKDVIVQVERGGRDAGRLEVATGFCRGRNTLRVVYPGPRVVYPAMGHGSQTSVRVASDGTFGNDLEWLGARKVTVAGGGSGLEAHADLVVRVPAGRDVAIHQAAGAVAATEVESRLLVDTGSGAVTASKLRGKVTLDTGSGDVVAEDLHGDLVIDTGSGAVRLSGASGGRIVIDTGSGDVEVEGVEADHLGIDTGSGGVRGGGVIASELVVDTGSGGIEMAAVKAPTIHLDTGSGHVRLQVLAAVRSLLVDTGSGGVTVDAPKGLDADFDLDSSGGGVHIDLPHEVFSKDEGHVRGRFGSGAGRIHIETGSGVIQFLAHD